MILRILTLAFAAALLAACGDAEQSATDTETSATEIDLSRITNIRWDEWGVPHVEAASTEGLFYGLGWSHMQLHGDLILELYGRARGRAAEYWGAEFLERDQLTHLAGVPARAEAWWDAQSEEYQNFLIAYTQGMNDYAAAHPEALNDERERALPILPTDPLAHTQWAIHLTFVARGLEDEAAAWTAAVQAGAGMSPTAVSEPAPVRQPEGDKERGSNAWAVAPSRSTSGNAMLLANPHLPWFDLFFFTEAHLSGPDLNAYGVTLLGTPFLAIAFNDYLGWTHTVNTYDGMDTYDLQLSASGGYMLDGEDTAFDVSTVTINVLQDDGSLAEETVTIMNSLFGPVFAMEGDRALALRIAGLEGAQIFSQYVEMGRARNLDEFTAAVSALQMPMFNTIYADRHGDIGYFFNAAMPQRNGGDVAYWGQTVPGNTRDTLWTEYHAFAELPRFRNPPSGFLQNANDPPWTSTFPQILNARDYPAYFAPEGMAFRPQHSARLLMADDDISFDELVTYANDTTSETARRIMPDLIAILRRVGDGRLVEAADVLDAWDGQTLSASEGAVLFHNWVIAMGRDGVFAEPWSATEPLATPRGIADPGAAIAGMRGVIAQMDEAGQPLNVPWGDARRIIYGPHNLPSSAGSGAIGSFRVGGWRPSGQPGVMVNISGTSYVAAIEFGAEIRARGYLAYGNATQDGHPNMGDQVPLYSEGTWRDIHFYPDEVEAHTVLLEELTY